MIKASIIVLGIILIFLLLSIPLIFAGSVTGSFTVTPEESNKSYSQSSFNQSQEKIINEQKQGKNLFLIIVDFFKNVFDFFRAK